MIRNFRVISLITALATLISACSFLPLPESTGAGGPEPASAFPEVACSTPTPEAAIAAAGDSTSVESGGGEQAAAGAPEVIDSNTDNTPSEADLNARTDGVNLSGPGLKDDGSNAPSGAPDPGTETGIDGDKSAVFTPTATPCP